MPSPQDLCQTDHGRKRKKELRGSEKGHTIVDISKAGKSTCQICSTEKGRRKSIFKNSRKGHHGEAQTWPSMSSGAPERSYFYKTELSDRNRNDRIQK